ncbi:MAG: hypothetical protein FJ318_03985 [SAR202 cluster bacterium]|nr:hypothetical protein [SAR202 cluster bacterium]
MNPSGNRFVRLRYYNLAMGAFHFAQGIIILALSSDFSLPVTAAFLDGPPGSVPPGVTELFSVRIGWAVAGFLFLSAFAHFIVASPLAFGWYKANLQRDRNYARWIEYFFSASLMMVLIAMLPGITDVAALLAIFFVNGAMILFGLIMEHYETPGRANWLTFWLGSIMGLVPWVAVGIYLWSPTTEANPPAFVYGIFFSIFIFFNVFAVNMALQYLRVGPWRNYFFGEAFYVLLSLVAKSALAWQVFAGTLVPE